VTYQSPFDSDGTAAVHMMLWFAFTMGSAMSSFFSARLAQWCGPADS